MSKFVIVTGGAVSKLGKGVFIGALGRILKNRGVRINTQIFNTYLNVDPGTMSPYQHGEVFVTDDGGEVDLDIGHIERFLDENISKANSVTGGKIYSAVINKERMGKYVGATVQVVPHITTEIKDKMLSLSNEETDVVLVEISGSVNDYETGVYLQAIKQLVVDVGEDNVFLAHLELLNYLESADEMGVELIQSSIQKINSYGLNVDALVCRTQKNINISEQTKKRIIKRCYLKNENQIIHDPDVETIYSLPDVFQKQGLDDLILTKFSISLPKADLGAWNEMVMNYSGNYQTIRICIVGKYAMVKDAYISIIEALQHAAAYNQIKIQVDVIDAEDIEEAGADKFLRGAKAIIIPSGWGSRGFDGMIQAIRYARESKIPYLGIGLGMQLAVVEVARDALGLKNANTTEIDQNTPDPVIDVMAGQKASTLNGSTLRLGSYVCDIDADSFVAKLYGAEQVNERHRHRYEVNGAYVEKFNNFGLTFVGKNPQTQLFEIAELKNHPFFVCTIFEPEFKSRPNKPHPLFVSLVNTAKSVR